MPKSCDVISAELYKAQTDLDQIEADAGDKITRYEQLVVEVESLEAQMKEIGAQLSYVKECQFRLGNHGYSDLDALNAAIVEAYDKIDALRTQAAAIRAEMERLQAEYEALAAKEEELSNEITALEEEAQEIRNHIDGVEEDIAIKEDQGDLYEELESRLASIDEHRDNDEHAEALEEFEELLAEIDSYEALLAELERLHADLDVLQGELSQVEQTITARQEELGEVQRLLADNDILFDDDVKELEDIGSDVSAQELEIAELETLYEECADMEGVDVGALETELANLIAEYTPLRSELSSLEFDEDIRRFTVATEATEKADRSYFAHNCDKQGDDAWEGGDEELPYDLPEEYEGEEYETGE